jgi:hypothetical protein
MRVPPVRSATPADEGPAIDTIVLAFAADPVARWCWPDAHQYLASMPGFTRAFGGGAFVHNGAHCTDDYAATALWLPPNVRSDESAGQILERTVSASIRGTLLPSSADGESITCDPHWYLPLIGVDPAGKVRVAALRSWRAPPVRSRTFTGVPQSTNPRNVPLYTRHGFEVVGTQIQKHWIHE